MDNVTHSLLGAALAKTRLGRLHRFAPLSLIVGANLPDIDIVSALMGGRAAYLLHHRGMTHSLLGAVVGALLLALVMRAVERRGAARAARAARETEPPIPWRCFLLPALVGVLSHPLLDLLNNYGLRPWLPFSQTRYYGDLVFIVDPWLGSIFGAVALLAGPRTREGHVVWACTALGTVAFILWHPRAPVHLRLGFPIVVLLLAALRASGVGATRGRVVVATGALILATYLGGLLALRELAVRRALARPDDERSVLHALNGPAELAMVSPAIADPFHWSLCLETPHQFVWRGVGVDGRRDARMREAALERPFDEPLVEAAVRSDEASAWRYFTRIPWAWIDRKPGGGASVGLSDARYQWAQGKEWCAVEIDFSPAEVQEIERRR